MKKFFILFGLTFALLFTSGCSSLKTSKINGVWVLKSAPGWNLDLTKNVLNQLKEHKFSVPTRLLFQEGSVIFEFWDHKTLQKGSITETDDGFDLLTFSDNTTTHFVFSKDKNEISVMWKGREHVYLTGGLAR